MAVQTILSEMTRPVGQRRRLAPLVALVVLALLLLPFYRWHLTPDGISYLSIAEHYARGDLADAVNAYWSPLFSWLLVPLIALGLPATITAKLVSIVVAVATLLVARRLAAQVGVDEPTLTWLTWGLVPFLLGAAFVVVTPDLLVALLVVLLMLVVTAPRFRTSPVTAALAGLVAGLAYLAKLYALPFALVLLPVVGAVLISRGERPGRMLRQVGIAAAVLLVVVAVWSAALTAVTGTMTPGTAGGLNLRYLSASSWGAPSQWAGFLPPPHPDAVSAWEDPPEALEQVDEVREGDAGAAPPGAPPGAEPGVGSGVDPFGLVGRAVANVDDLLVVALWWSPVIGLAVAWPFLRRRRPVRRRDRRTPEPPIDGALLVAAAAIVWTGGLAVTYPQERYLWAALLLAAPLAGRAVDTVRRRGVSRDAAGLLGILLVVGLIPAGVADLADVWRESDDVPAVTAAIARDVDLDGARVASNGSWAGMLGLCLELDCRYYGVPAPGWGEAEVAEALAADDIGYFFSVGGELPSAEPVAAARDAGVYVYDTETLAGG